MNNSITLDNHGSNICIDDDRGASSPSFFRCLIERVARTVAASITQSAQTGDRWLPPHGRPLDSAPRRWFAAHRRGPVRLIADDEQPMSAHRKIWLDVAS